jgi:hypothetical protein
VVRSLRRRPQVTVVCGAKILGAGGAGGGAGSSICSPSSVGSIDWAFFKVPMLVEMMLCNLNFQELHLAK